MALHGHVILHMHAEHLKVMVGRAQYKMEGPTNEDLGRTVSSHLYSHLVSHACRVMDDIG